MGEWFSTAAGSGSLALAIPVAMVAGLVSFFSPCVIPLLPGYLSYATGLSGADLEDARRGRMLAGSLLFVLGFAAVFVALGTLSGALGAWLIDLAAPDHARARRRHDPARPDLRRTGAVAAARLADPPPCRPSGWEPRPCSALLFGLGWIPCMGPTLGVILTLSVNEATAGRGALLSACYALGLGLPFIAAGLAYRRMLGAFGFVRRHQQWVTRVGGLMLVAVGVLLVTGWWAEIVTWLQIRLVSDFETSI